MKEKFKYYLNEDGSPKSLDIYQAIQISKEEASVKSKADVKKKYRELAFQFDPDKNAQDQKHATAAFELIDAAYNHIIDGENLAKFQQGDLQWQDAIKDILVDIFKQELASVPWVDTFEPGFRFGEVSGIDEINNLTKKLEAYAQKKAMLKETNTALNRLVWIGVVKEFQQIIDEFSSLYQETFVTQTRSNAQAEFLDKLGEVAETADEIYAVHKFSQYNDRFYDAQSVNSYVHKAAALGHPVALRTVASLCLLGIYSNQKQAITFGINTIKQLRASLSDGTFYSDEMRQKLGEDLLRAESRYADILAIENIDEAVAARIEQLAMGSIYSRGPLAQDIIAHKTYNDFLAEPQVGEQCLKVEKVTEPAAPMQEPSTTTSVTSNSGFMIKYLSAVVAVSGMVGLIIATMGLAGVGVAAGLASLKLGSIAAGGGVLAGLGTLGLFAFRGNNCSTVETEPTPAPVY